LRSKAGFGVAALWWLCASSVSAEEVGVASYYDNPHYSGLIAAHRTLPLGTRVRVTNLSNHRSVIVIIIDRGPFLKGRVIDLSLAAADALGFRDQGLARVSLDPI